MINHTKGNLIDLAEQGEFDVIVHGCNCLNTMGSGIAKEIRERYPIAFEADTDTSEVVTQPIEKLGNFSYVTNQGNIFTGNFFVIVNAYTQLGFLPRGVDHFEYESFGLILRKLAALYPDKRFGFPYIGMGLAGGDKYRILAMLEDFAAKITETGGTVTLVEFA
jgi:O-acetyl-ADP-ribose deacetylase (regulator of RNase III)